VNGGEPALGLAVPLHDEVEICRKSTRGLLRALEETGLPYRVVFVDNGSRDGTWSELQEITRLHASASLLRLSSNLGYGGGILAGMELLETPYVGWHWGDGQIEPRVVVEAWRRLREGTAPMVKAVRTCRLDGARRVLMSRAYHLAAHASLHLSFRDLNGCPKIFRLPVWRRIAAGETGWLLDLEVMRAAARLGFHVDEVEASMRPRAGGRSHVGLTTPIEFLRGMTRMAQQDARPSWPPSRDG
jgi:glycosyltransferase involved in cell wall biosynthesis